MTWSRVRSSIRRNPLSSHPLLGPGPRPQWRRRKRPVRGLPVRGWLGLIRSEAAHILGVWCRREAGGTDDCIEHLSFSLYGRKIPNRGTSAGEGDIPPTLTGDPMSPLIHSAFPMSPVILAHPIPATIADSPLLHPVRSQGPSRALFRFEIDVPNANLHEFIIASFDPDAKDHLRQHVTNNRVESTTCFRYVELYFESSALHSRRHISTRGNHNQWRRCKGRRTSEDHISRDGRKHGSARKCCDQPHRQQS